VDTESECDDKDAHQDEAHCEKDCKDDCDHDGFRPGVASLKDPLDVLDAKDLVESWKDVSWKNYHTKNNTKNNSKNNNKNNFERKKKKMKSRLSHSRPIDPSTRKAPPGNEGTATAAATKHATATKTAALLPRRKQQAAAAAAAAPPPPHLGAFYDMLRQGAPPSQRHEHRDKHAAAQADAADIEMINVQINIDSQRPRTCWKRRPEI